MPVVLGKGECRSGLRQGREIDRKVGENGERRFEVVGGRVIPESSSPLSPISL